LTDVNPRSIRSNAGIEPQLEEIERSLVADVNPAIPEA
jgi:hypothetical protein